MSKTANQRLIEDSEKAIDASIGAVEAGPMKETSSAAQVLRFDSLGGKPPKVVLEKARRVIEYDSLEPKRVSAWGAALDVIAGTADRNQSQADIEDLMGGESIQTVANGPGLGEWIGDQRRQMERARRSVRRTSLALADDLTAELGSASSLAALKRGYEEGVHFTVDFERTLAAHNLMEARAAEIAEVVFNLYAASVNLRGHAPEVANAVKNGFRNRRTDFPSIALVTKELREATADTPKSREARRLAEAKKEASKRATETAILAAASRLGTLNIKTENTTNEAKAS